MLTKLLLGAVLVMLALTMINMMVYADEGRYYSYTKAIKYCDNDRGCVLQDFVIHCKGDRVVDIEPLPRWVYVSDDFDKEGLGGWCDS